MSRKPNVVFVLTDDQGYGDLGCSGNSIINTPNIDAFYNESIRLTDYHVGPTCAPTRAGLMTGHYANSTGVWHTVGGRSLLRKNEVTLAKALKDCGYRTGIFGKWHLGDAFPYRPMDRGFEKTVIHGGGGISQTPDYWGNDYFDDTYCVDGKFKEFKGYCTDVFFGEALDFIEEHKDETFFCYIAPNAPHGPFNVDSKYSEPYMDLTNPTRAKFYGMITNIDENFAKLLQKLEDLNLSDDTIVVFMTDNGTSCGMATDEFGFTNDGFNAGLRGGKNSEYDGGHRTPFFIRYPNGAIKGGLDFDMLTANVDFMPTILDFCEVSCENLSFHGKSLASNLKGMNITDERVLVTDSQRLTYPEKWRKSAVMTKEWRLVNGKELYEIEKDREQRFDVSEQYPKVLAKLRSEYDKWWDIVSEQYDSIIPFTIGDKAIDITCHDIRNDESHTAWNQKSIREALKIEGYYEVEIESSGVYDFELRRWPKEINTSITSRIDEDNDVTFKKDFIDEKDWKYYMGSEAIDVEYAKVDIQGNSKIIKLDKDLDYAKLTLSLREGEGELYCSFLDKDKMHVTSAYYVGISKVTG